MRGHCADGWIVPGAVRLVIVVGALAGAAAPAHGKLPPLRDPVFLNIGFVCKWQERCIKDQQRAQRRAVYYVKTYRPATWKIQLCNRNASRRNGRVDWIGYYNCIRNKRLVRPPVVTPRRR
jgi:hypothetical protein